MSFEKKDEKRESLKIKKNQSGRKERDGKEEKKSQFDESKTKKKNSKITFF